MPVRFILLAVFALACACRTVDGGDATRVVVRDGDGAPLYDAQATFVLRQPERVIAIRPYGEIHVGVDGDDARCRFVWSKDGLDALSILDGERCPRRDNDRICFDGARFSGTGRVPTLVVDGCAYENDLMWSKLQGTREVGVGPTQWRTRCARVPPQQTRCDLTYLALVDVEVHDNAEPRSGFFFTYQADSWRACFAERDSGAYRLVIDVEDGCGARQRVTLEGDSSALDD